MALLGLPMFLVGWTVVGNLTDFPPGKITILLACVAGDIECWTILMITIM